VRAALAEPRFVAVAIVVLGVTLAILLSSIQPASLTVLNSLLGTVVCGGCVLLAGTGVMAVLAVTRP
jgi:hypothetical protein